MLEDILTVSYPTPVPNKLLLDSGPSDEMVRLNVRIPRWLKKEIAKAISSRGKNLNDWCRDMLKDGLARTLKDGHRG